MKCLSNYHCIIIDRSNQLWYLGIDVINLRLFIRRIFNNDINSYKYEIYELIKF